MTYARLLAGILILSAVPVFAAESVPQENTGPFAGNAAEAVWTLITFVILLIALRKFAWNPIITGLKNRQQYIEKQIADAEAIKKKANEVLEQYKQKLDNVEQEGKIILANYVRKAEDQQAKIIEQAKQQAEEIKQKAFAEIERQQVEAEKQLWQQAGEIVLRLGEEVFSKTLDEQDNRKLIEEAIETLKKSKAAKDN